MHQKQPVRNSKARMWAVVGGVLAAAAMTTTAITPSQAADTTKQGSKPNIVLILMDNLGYGEVGVYGGGITRGGATPRIDALAAGYATGMFGKWHLGQTQGRLPTDQGFDEWYGIPNSTDESLWPSQAQFNEVVKENLSPGMVPGAEGWAGPWRGTYFTALEASLRVPFIIRWPGHIPAHAVSDEIVHEMDLYSTFAQWTGGKVPTDRVIDSIDQSTFFEGKQEKSNRDNVVVYVGKDIYGVKWRNWKSMFKEVERGFGEVHNLSTPHFFNLYDDPREEQPMHESLAVLGAVADCRSPEGSCDVAAEGATDHDWHAGSVHAWEEVKKDAGEEARDESAVRREEGNEVGKHHAEKIT